MSSTEHQPLPTEASELATLHATRASLYRLLFEALRKPPRPELFEESIRMLDGLPGAHPAVAELRNALAAADAAEAGRQFSRLFAAPQPPVSIRCKWSNCGVRDSAFKAADTLPSGDRIGELHVMAELAGRTAHDLAAARLEEAAAYVDVQSRFLTLHAAACLADLASELQASPSPIYSKIGGALALLVKRDSELLGSSRARG